MNDPTEILDTLAARAAADPVAAVPQRGALEAELRNRRRRHRIARVGVGVVVLLIGGVSWSALRDADTDGVIVVAAEETPAPDAGDSGAPQPTPTEEPTAPPAPQTVDEDFVMRPLPGDACTEGIGAPRDASVLLGDLADAAPPGTPIDRIRLCTTPAEVQSATLSSDRSELVVRYENGEEGCGELYSVVLRSETSTVEVRTGRFVNACPDAIFGSEVVVAVPEDLRNAAAAVSGE